jgi:RNA polymerase sigma-70 factor (ECF subfamily)
LGRLGLTDLWIDDAVQDVFIVAHAYGGYHPGAASPRTWLGAIAIRVAANARRKQRRLSAVMVPHSDVERCLQRYSLDPTSATAALSDVELRDAVGRALHELSAADRDVLLRFYIRGEACEPIAAAIGVPVGTVYSRLHHARKRFIALLS